MYPVGEENIQKFLGGEFLKSGVVLLGVEFLGQITLPTPPASAAWSVTFFTTPNAGTALKTPPASAAWSVTFFTTPNARTALKTKRLLD